jgi:hypothetical protein
MSLFSTLFRNRALKQYARLLPRQLAKDYGAADVFTPAQIKASATRLKLNPAYHAHAHAMFLPEREFAEIYPTSTYAERRAKFQKHIRQEDVAAHFTESGTGFGLIDGGGP